MANEITVTTSIKYAKGNVAEISRALSKQITVSGTQHVHHVQSIGTSAEALDIGDLTTLGWCWMKNLDATNYVSIRSGADGANVINLDPGEAALFRLATNTPFAIADTAPVELEYLIIED